LQYLKFRITPLHEKNGPATGKTWGTITWRGEKINTGGGRVRVPAFTFVPGGVK
jgi:hypothetical protein